MLAVRCNAFGPPDSLSVEDVPLPACGPGMARVRVHAAGVNFPDTLIIEGKYQLRAEPPFSPGAEITGVVEAVGEGVANVKPGERVMALPGYGGFAEYVTVEAARLTPLPETMDFVTGAGFAMTYGTSMHALKQRGRLKPGETLLVLGAAGGVGLAAVEIGRQMGARVIAAASSPEKLEIARQAGASDFIDYRRESLKERVKELTQGRGVDVVYDPVGGDLFDEALRCLAWNGRLLVVGFASGRIPNPPVNLVLLKGSEIVGVFWGAFRRAEPAEDARNFQTLFDWHAQKRLNPRIDRVLPLERAGEALNALLRREVAGKIVLTPPVA